MASTSNTKTKSSATKSCAHDLSHVDDDVKRRQFKQFKREVLTAANIITIVRILLIPLFVFVLLAPWPEWLANALPYDFGVDHSALANSKPLIALIVFVILALTDSVDGYLARSLGEVTTIGKFLDPLADKLLVTAALLALIELGELPAWIALIIISREFVVSGLRMILADRGTVMAASFWGKLKTVLQIVAISLFIARGAGWVQELFGTYFDYFNYGSWIVMLLAILATILSMADYFYQASVNFGVPIRNKRANKGSSSK